MIGREDQRDPAASDARRDAVEQAPDLFVDVRDLAAIAGPVEPHFAPAAGQELVGRNAAEAVLSRDRQPATTAGLPPGCGELSLAESRGRRVGSMGVLVVDPEEDRSARRLEQAIEHGQGGVGGTPGGALEEAPHALARIELDIVVLEAPLQAAARSQHVVAHHRARAPAAGVEAFGQGLDVPQPVRVVVDARFLRPATGEQRDHRGQRVGGRRVGALEHHGFGGQGVEPRRQAEPGPVRTQVIRAQRIHGNEQHVRGRTPAAPRDTQREQPHRPPHSSSASARA